MKRKMNSLIVMLILCFAVLLICSCNTGNNEEQTNNGEPQIDCFQFRGEISEETFFSTNVNDEFKISIYLPEGYANSTTQYYPVIYQLDADPDHRITSEWVSQLSCQELMPRAIVVGIGYTTGNNHRLRDMFYPYDDYYPQSGGGLDFYNFIIEELIPYIDGNYRTDNTTYGRTLMGHSAGGYFVLFAFFKYKSGELNHITNFVASSPVIHYHDRYLLEQEGFFETPSLGPLQVKLYISIGSEGGAMRVAWYEMVMRMGLRAIEPEWFSFKSKEFPQLSHEEVGKPTYKEGLRFIFN